MENTALLLIDLQNDYYESFESFESFENAKWKLKNTEEATYNALKLLNKFREKNMNLIQKIPHFSFQTHKVQKFMIH